MNERQKFALTVLLNYQGEPIEASTVGNEHFRDAQRRGDEELVRKLRLRSSNIGWGRTLLWLNDRDFARREFRESSATYRYEITEQGRQALHDALGSPFWRATVNRGGGDRPRWLRAATMLEARRVAERSAWPASVTGVRGPLTEQDFRNAVGIPEDAPLHDPWWEEEL